MPSTGDCDRVDDPALRSGVVRLGLRRGDGGGDPGPGEAIDPGSVLFAPRAESGVRARPGRPSLEHAHLAWAVGDAAALERLGPTRLHAREREHLAGLRYERRRHTFLLGRVAARLALARQVGDAPLAELAVMPGVFTQPVVHGGRGDAAVTICHAGHAGLAIAYPGGHPLGVDIERCDAARADALVSQCGADELDAARRAGGSDVELLTMCWTAKEALSKILRCGMMCPFELLATTSVRGAPGGGYEGEFVNFSQYRFVSLPLPEAYFLTLALPRRTSLTVPLASLVEGIGSPRAR